MKLEEDGKELATVTVLGDALAHDPANGWYHYRRARLVYGMGRKQEALQDLNRAFRRSPHLRREIHEVRGVLHTEPGNPCHALRDLEHALQHGCEDEMVRTMRDDLRQRFAAMTFGERIKMELREKFRVMVKAVC